MKKIAFIPIDNRPVCYELPKQIASLDEQYEFLIPDKAFLGDLKKDADINKIFSWMKSLSNIDYYVISLDTIAYGGLIPSRRSNESFEKIKSRIDTLKEIIEKSNAQVSAFSSVMRISNNNINEEEKEYWNEYGEKIFQYSYSLHESEVCPNSKNSINIYIPEYILQDYLKTRKRNFEINKYYIELKKQGIFNTLVFSKDDCAKYGLNVKEANELKKISKDCKNIYIKTGADEIPLTLLSKVINTDKKLKIAPVYTRPEEISKISKYEDITVKDSVQSQIELSGGIISDIRDCDIVMLINNFKAEQGELVMNVETELFSGKIELPDKPYFIADIVNANGSDNNFVKKFLNKENKKDFYGYAAWNTTGNTLGSALSCAMTYYKAKNPNKKEFLKLQMIRFLDDWAYQANVRKNIRDDIKNIGNDIIYKKMKDYEQILSNKFGVVLNNVEYSYPWKRFFEIEIEIKI